MAQRGLTYSQVVSFLKVVLPLAALALLSTMFLFAQNIEPVAVIPFAQIDLEERARQQRITAPYISGKNDRGDLVALTASTAKPDPEKAGLFHVNKLDARIDLISGARVTFSSESGLIDNTDQRVELTGGVLILTSTGYSIKTKSLVSSFSELSALANGKISASGPPGEFTAGAMQLVPDSTTGDAHFLFTNGVNLVYMPKG